MKPRYIPLIGLLLAVLVGVAFWYFLYQPRSDEQAALVEETAQLETEQQRLRNEIAQLEEIKANEVEIRAALTRLGEFIPAGIAQPTVVRQFQETADAAGVEIVSVTFGAPEPMVDAPPTGEPVTILASVPMTMVIDGGYFQVVDFLRRLEIDVPRAMLVGSVAVAEAEDKFPSLTTTWTGTLFSVIPTPADAIQPAPEAEAPAEAPADGEQPAPEGDQPAPAEEGDADQTASPEDGEGQ